MCRRLALHVDFEYSRGILQEKSLFLPSPRWVYNLFMFMIATHFNARQTPASKRQEYVNEFNKASQETCCKSNTLLVHQSLA